MTWLLRWNFLSSNYTLNIWCVMNQRSSISLGLIIIPVFSGCSRSLAHFFQCTRNNSRCNHSEGSEYSVLVKITNKILESESIRVMKVIQYHYQNSQADIQCTREQMYRYKPLRMKYMRERWTKRPRTKRTDGITEQNKAHL